MRTVIAPLDAEVAAQLAALAPPLDAIARRFIARLALEPLLGHRLTRGRLATVGCRAVYFDRDSRPDDLFGAAAHGRRRGDQDASAGPRWRIVYRPVEARRAGVRIILVLAVRRAHTEPGTDDVYDAAARHLDRLNWRPR